MERKRLLSIDWCLKLRREGKQTLRMGFTVDTIGPDECPYLRRWILWLEPLCTIRLHKFFRSDQDEALHSHPWPFITFPLKTYREWVPNYGSSDEVLEHLHTEEGEHRVLQEVKAFRFHYRPASYTHAVVVDSPGYTIVATRCRTRVWGFWLGHVFTPWKEWFQTRGTPACADPEQAAIDRVLEETNS